MRKIVFIVLIAIGSALAYAGTDSIPTRSDGQTMTADWSNLFKRVLSLDLVPRNSSGVVVDKAGNIGSATHNWNSVNTEALKLRSPGGSTQVTLAAPSPLPSPYAMSLPSALPTSTALPLHVAPNGLSAFTQIQTAAIADGAITQAKRAALNYQISGNCGYAEIPANSTIDVPNLSITITTTGRPVFFMLISDGAYLNDSFMGMYLLRFYRDTTIVGKYIATLIVPHVDTPPAGTYTYKVKAYNNGATNVMINWRLFVVEL